MRVLWIIVAVLLAAGASVAVVRFGAEEGASSARRQAAGFETPAAGAEEIAPAAGVERERDDQRERDELDAAIEELLAEEEGAGAEDEQSLFSFVPGKAPERTGEMVRRGTASEPSGPRPSGTGVERLASMQGSSLDDLLEELGGEPIEGAGGAGGAGGADEAALGGDGAAEETVAKEADEPAAQEGALAADDGRFEIPGSGTREDPYRLSWDLLLSANETYRPRQGMNDLPGWTEKLDGKWVQISGFIAYPMFATEVDEVLLMKNQWDGCCLGVPPTPYDAVEVTLEAKSDAKQHSFLYGSITGRFKVEPYLQGRWLLGLYLMEEASMRLDM